MASLTTITSLVKDTRQEMDNFRGLSASRRLAKWPIVGFVMFIFGGLAYTLLEEYFQERRTRNVEEG